LPAPWRYGPAITVSVIRAAQLTSTAGSQRSWLSAAGPRGRAPAEISLATILTVTTGFVCSAHQSGG
jgi:hypothetical protein